MSVLRLRGGGGAVHQVNSPAQLQTLIDSHPGQLVVVDFFANWCGPCRNIAPHYVKLSEEFSNVVFAKVDVDDNPELAEMYSIEAMPTFAFVKGGAQVATVMGADITSIRKNVTKYQ